MESRAFPGFSYDPSAGKDWASRFALDDNPQVERDWPIHHFSYEDAEHQRITEEVAFTFVDFVACDRRYASTSLPWRRRMKTTRWRRLLAASIANRRACPTSFPAC